jgi:hypothetical protein
MQSHHHNAHELDEFEDDQHVEHDDHHQDDLGEHQHDASGHHVHRNRTITMANGLAIQADVYHNDNRKKGDTNYHSHRFQGQDGKSYDIEHPGQGRAHRDEPRGSKFDFLNTLPIVLPKSKSVSVTHDQHASPSSTASNKMIEPSAPPALPHAQPPSYSQATHPSRLFSGSASASSAPRRQTFSSSSSSSSSSANPNADCCTGNSNDPCCGPSQHHHHDYHRHHDSNAGLCGTTSSHHEHHHHHHRNECRIM